MNKLFLALTLFVATLSPVAPVQKAEASPGLVLGIIGTALGGSALGLGVYNTIQNRRLRNEYYNDRYYDQYGSQYYDQYNDDYYEDQYNYQNAAYDYDYADDDSDYYYY